MKLQRIKLSDIVKEKMTNKEIELLRGGGSYIGCTSYLCSYNTKKDAGYLCSEAGSMACLAHLA